MFGGADGSAAGGSSSSDGSGDGSDDEAAADEARLAGFPDDAVIPLADGQSCFHVATAILGACRLVCLWPNPPASLCSHPI